MSAQKSQHSLQNFEEQEASFSILFDANLINQFCEMSGDYHPLHCDREYAIGAGFKDIIAHGALITSFGSRMIGMNIPGRRSLIVTQEAEFVEPVYPGDLLLYHGKILKFRKNLDLVQVMINVTNAEDKIVATMHYSVKLRAQ